MLSKKFLVTFIVTFVCSYFLFVNVDYTTKVYLVNVGVPLVYIYGVLYALCLSFSNKQKADNLDVVMLFSISCVVLGAIFSPVEEMTEFQRKELPCKGYIDPEFEGMFKDFPSFSKSCKSVIHAGHGQNSEYGHLTRYKGKQHATSEMIKQYPTKKQYVFSCRGNGLTSYLTLSFSFLFQDKNKEIVDGKEILWFAKDGNILIATKVNFWINF